MSFKQKSDYIALQNLWYTCSDTYLKIQDRSARVKIIDDFRDTLLDITREGAKAIRSNYDMWEKETWLTMCREHLDEWVKRNPFEARVNNNRQLEYSNIKADLNYLRYRKIMQLIQDSGIGLGQGGSTGGSFNAGPKNKSKFTG